MDNQLTLDLYRTMPAVKAEPKADKTFHVGDRVQGKDEGKPFTGIIIELNGISTIDLDRPMVFHDLYHDRLYMGFDHITGLTTCDDHYHSPKENYVRLIPDTPGSECELLPPPDFVVEAVRKNHPMLNRAQYFELQERHHTTYRTVKKTVTCEYGCQHKIDVREPVKPTLDQRAVSFAYGLYVAASLAVLADDLDFQARQSAWDRVCRRMSHGGGAFAHKANYTGLSPELTAILKQGIDETYTAICDDYLVKIFGTGHHLNRYLTYESRMSCKPKSERRARLEKRLGGKIGPDGLEAVNLE